MGPKQPPSSSRGRNILSLFHGIFSSIGQSWQGEDAQKAFDAGKLCSTSVDNGVGGTALRVVFRNLTPVPLLLCWVSENGTLHHFYKLNPWAPPTNIAHASYQDSLADFMSHTDHTEHTNAGHAFCCIHVENEEDLQHIRSVKSLEGYNANKARIVGGYRPNLATTKDHASNKVQLVEISFCSRNSSSKEQVNCNPFCSEPPGNLRKRKAGDSDSGNEESRIFDNQGWTVHAGWGNFDMTPIDTTNKVYQETLIGGWPCCVEPNWSNGDKELEQRLAEDLALAAKHLPDHAEAYLKKHCKFWINKSISWGPKACPVKGVALCYHPERRWLVENGLHAEKAHCVEINCASFYKKDCDYWGRGGLLLHELSHAYHHSCLPDGYSNRDIEECFQKAMKDRLYEKVKVHGPQGPMARAYACTNAMEYWAELSTAFLGGLDKKKEFNKWYPFNRQQLKDHDPRAFGVLSKLWQADAVVKT